MTTFTKNTQLGQLLMGQFLARWDSATATQKVIIAGEILQTFGDSAIADQQDKGYPCPMLRVVARMMSATI